MLNQYEATSVLHDFSKAKVPVFTGNAKFVYMRFHGHAGNYSDSYNLRALDEKAE